MKNRDRIMDTERVLMTGRWEEVWGMGEQGGDEEVQIGRYRVAMGM